jgi:hypothetical protein
MPMIENETRTREATCPTHGRVQAEKQLPKIAFPFVVTGAARGIAAVRPFRCPTCGAKVS